MHLDPELKAILKHYLISTFVFYTIPINALTHLDEDFEESDLPYKVDIINWNKISDSFRKNIEKDLVKIQ
jgi:hypothetical protein